MIYELFGWIGAILVLLAYYLLSTKRLDNGLTYNIINLAAGTCMAIGVFPKKAWFSFALQVFWSIIAIRAIIVNLKQEKESNV